MSRIRSITTEKSKIGVTASARNKRVNTSRVICSSRVIQFDNNNIYPNLLEFYIENSSYTMTVIRAFRSVLYGKAFEDVNLNNQIFYNELGLKLSGKQILKMTEDDYSIHCKFALHVKYNALGLPASVKPIPVKNCRLTKPIDDEIKEIAYFDNWEGFYGELYMEEPLYLPVFNPENIANEFEACGGFENHKGQIYYYKSGLGRYELPIWDCAVDEIQTDIETKVYRKRLTQNNFNASAIIALPYKTSDQERKNIANKINNSQGSENAGAVIVLDGFTKETIPSVLKLDSTNQDKMYNTIDESTKNAIRRIINVPPVLVGDLVAGKLGGSQEIAESEQFFESNTTLYREDIEEALYDVFSKFYIPYTNVKIKTKYDAN